MAKIVLMSLNLTDISFRICLFCWNHSYFTVSLQMIPVSVTIFYARAPERVCESRHQSVRKPAGECARPGKFRKEKRQQTGNNA